MLLKNCSYSLYTKNKKKSKKSNKKIAASLEARQSSKCPLYLDLNSRNFSSLLVS
jgi:hypothetical protein